MTSKTVKAVKAWALVVDGQITWAISKRLIKKKSNYIEVLITPIKRKAKR